MALGDLFEATTADSTDLYYVDIDAYDTEAYGCVYILDAERPAIVDTGLGTHDDVVLEALAEVGIAPEDLEVIAPTHVHLDHAGGAGSLAEACPNADVYLYEAGADFLTDPGPIWEGTKKALGDRITHYEKPTPVPEDRLVELEDGETVDLGDHALEVHAAPGHAFHQAVFYDPANDGVFTGDAAGIYTPALDSVRHTSPPSDFDLEGCLEDVQMLQDIDPDVLYFGHFGDHAPDGLLDEYAETLRSWVEAVEEKRAELGDDDAVVDHFAEEAAAGGDALDAWGETHVRAEEEMNVRGVLNALDSREE